MRAALLFIFALLLAQAISASEVVLVGFDIHKDGSVALTALSAVEGVRQRAGISNSGEYELRVEDASGAAIDSLRFDTSFILLSDPPVQSNVSSHLYRLNYTPGASRIRVMKGGNEIFRAPIPPLGSCNNNGICESGENSFGCLHDCDYGGAPLPLAWLGAAGVVACAAIAFFLLRKKGRHVATRTKRGAEKGV